jgi:hypothetical protein
MVRAKVTVQVMAQLASREDQGSENIESAEPALEQFV